MYNILGHLREVFNLLDRRGFQYEIPRNVFMAELKRSTSIFNDKTLNRWMHSFKELGYVRIKNAVILERCLNFDSPYIFNDGEDFKSAFDSSQLLIKNPEDKPIGSFDEATEKIKSSKVLTDEC